MPDWYKRNPVDALDGMAQLSLEEIGAYNILLDTIYRDGRGIEDNDAYVAGILRVTKPRWKRLRQALLDAGKLVVDGGRLHNERAMYELSMRDALKRKRQAAGKRGGTESGKSRKSAGAGEANASSKSNQIRGDKRREEKTPPLPPSGGQSPHGGNGQAGLDLNEAAAPKQPEPEQPKSKPPKRGTRLPDDWTPSADDRAYAAGRGFSDQAIDDMAANFAEYWQNKPGKGATKFDWFRTWQTWVRTEQKRRPPRRASSPPTRESFSTFPLEEL